MTAWLTPPGVVAWYSPQILYYAKSETRNLIFIATNLNNRVPDHIPYVFVYGVHSDPDPANRYSVLIRVAR